MFGRHVVGYPGAMTTLVRVARRSTAGERDRSAPGDRDLLAAGDRDRLRGDRDQMPARRLAVATVAGGVALDAARRTAALVMVAAVLIGAGGVAMAAATVLAGTWALGPVLTATVFAGVLLARTAWRYRIS
jgi:hypothetical protein